MNSRRQGIYVEILIAEELDTVWRLTQVPSLHQRWDLRFTQIEYLPKSSADEPQKFLYQTRIGFGLTIRGTGESVAVCAAPDGSTSSSLKFWSGDRISLIREGAGYWRYIPTSSGLRFLTWYDYRVSFGFLGRAVDLVFRPVMGWATAWSFDRLRLWAEEGQTPGASLAFAAIHALARTAIAGVWLWHGLVPKLIFHSADEQRMLAEAGLSLHALPWIGAGEVVFGILLLLLWRRRSLFAVNAALMLGSLIALWVRSPEYLTSAFNPVTLNAMMIALSAIGWLAARRSPTASRCLRRPTKGES